MRDAGAPEPRIAARAGAAAEIRGRRDVGRNGADADVVESRLRTAADGGRRAAASQAASRPAIPRPPPRSDPPALLAGGRRARPRRSRPPGRQHRRPRAPAWREEVTGPARDRLRAAIATIAMAAAGLLALYAILQGERLRIPILEERPFELKAE